MGLRLSTLHVLLTMKRLVTGYEDLEAAIFRDSEQDAILEVGPSKIRSLKVSWQLKKGRGSCGTLASSNTFKAATGIRA
jgi:hypothetical protein